MLAPKLFAGPFLPCRQLLTLKGCWGQAALMAVSRCRMDSYSNDISESKPPRHVTCSIFRGASFWGTEQTMGPSNWESQGRVFSSQSHCHMSPVQLWCHGTLVCLVKLIINPLEDQHQCVSLHVIPCGLTFHILLVTLGLQPLFLSHDFTWGKMFVPRCPG